MLYQSEMQRLTHYEIGGESMGESLVVAKLSLNTKNGLRYQHNPFLAHIPFRDSFAATKSGTLQQNSASHPD
jgi:hypothetical protein